MKKIIPFDIDLALNGADVRTKTHLYKVRNFMYTNVNGHWQIMGEIYFDRKTRRCSLWTKMGNYWSDENIHDFDLIIFVNYPIKDYIKDKIKAVLKYLNNGKI